MHGLGTGLRSNIICFDFQSKSFSPLGFHSIHTLSCLGISKDVSGVVNVIVGWTVTGGKDADFYLINITTNAPQTPYEGLLNITTASVKQCELTGFLAGYEYNITVSGVVVKHDGLKWSNSEPLTIRPQGRHVCLIYTYTQCMLYCVT